jgi:hypothetical protein
MSQQADGTPPSTRVNFCCAQRPDHALAIIDAIPSGA